jgi:hypothetical protein
MTSTTHLPPAASEMYTQLHSTALAFIDAQAHDATQPHGMNFARIESLCASDFEHSWGHNYAVSLNPRLQGTFSFAQFTKHLEAMLPNLDSFEITVTDVTVDEMLRKVVLRISFWMLAKGAEERVENDLVWVVEMDEEGKKVRRSREFIDGIAAGRLKELMMEGGKEGKVGR